MPSKTRDSRLNTSGSADLRLALVEWRRGPGDVEATAQVPLLGVAEQVDRAFELVADREQLDVDDPAWVLHGIGDPGPEDAGDGLRGRGTAPVRRRLLRRILGLVVEERFGPRLGRRRGRRRRFESDACPEPGVREQLVRPRHGPESPVVAADVGVVLLDAGAVGVVDFLERRPGLDAEDVGRVDFEGILHGWGRQFGEGSVAATHDQH